MHNHNPPFYIPITTDRNKMLIKAIMPGVFVYIDVVNSELPYDRAIAKAWIDEDDAGNGAATIWFESEQSGGRLKFGSVDEVRALMARSNTVL